MPDESTPQTRRKRGLSLRSQLLNKAVAASFNPFWDSRRSSQIELDNLGQESQSPGLPGQAGPSGLQSSQYPEPHGDYLAPPAITVDRPQDSYHKKEYPQYSQKMSRSTTRLTTISSANSSDDEGNEQRDSRFTRQKRFRNSWRGTFKKYKDKLLGRSQLGASETGRIIPVCLRKEKANSIFSDEYYSKTQKAYVDERSGEPYIGNTITSSKYNIYTFLPKQLRAQFSKLANCYFMVVAIMQMIPTWSTTGQFTTIIPLMIFMSISIAREGFDDWKRHTHDKEENSKIASVVCEDADLASFDTQSIHTIMTETIPVGYPEEPSQNSSVGSLVDGSKNIFSNTIAMTRYNLRSDPTTWKDIKVGDILQINENEWIPADIILLAVDSDETEAFVETMALDGETNFKSKFAHPELSKLTQRPSDLKNARCLVTTEDPNPDLYNFEGHFSSNGTDYALGLDNVVYRGSILRNTRSVLGLVVFTGEESKIRMNNLKNPRTKAPKLQRNINFIVLFMIFVVIILSAMSTMAQRIYLQNDLHKAWYLYDQDVGIAATLMGFIIMYNTLIPLSLYVTMEIIKVMQLVFLQYDIDMYDVKSNTPADAKTATILEELGQVSYVFSDKTGTLTDNEMLLRKFSVCGANWIHDTDQLAEEKEDPGFGDHYMAKVDAIRPSQQNKAFPPTRKSTTSIVRQSMELSSIRTSTSWRSTAQPEKEQHLASSLYLLKYIQTNPQTIFSRKATFFLLSIALCHTCQPRKAAKGVNNSSTYTLTGSSEEEQVNDLEEDAGITYQAASPDELALADAARDLGFVIADKQNGVISVKTYPHGFDEAPRVDRYEILDVVEFNSVRKRMSVVVKFPDGRIGVICKGADNIILDLLKNADLAKKKARDIFLSSADRKTQEAEIVLQSKVSAELENRRSLSSLRGASIDAAERIGSIDNIVSRQESDISQIAAKARQSLHMQQNKRYSLDEHNDADTRENSHAFIPKDKLLVNEEFVIEKTLEHIEEFSSEGLRTLLYSFKWLSSAEYDQWSTEYREAKIALSDRAKRVEEVGAKIENNFDLLGATAIEDKLQDGVSEAIDKLRRAGIKMWMLTGDKRETAINIGYSCRLIKDYSTVVVLSSDEGTERLTQRISTASSEIKAGRIAHSVVVVDGATLGEIESDPTLFSVFIELCIQTDSAICCRASPSQKASMINSVRQLRKRDVTLAIGDGANDIAMIQSADIGVGITGKEGLQAARSADYAIAQFRFLLKLLLVNGRYNYIRTSKFVLTTFYKELLFYLTQCVYQRYTMFTGTSMYEKWSLSMFNTLFTSLPVLCVGMFDKDLKPSTLLAVPELYGTGRNYRAFNLKIFIYWMALAALQSVAVSFIAYFTWGFSATKDNTSLPLGTMVFWTLVIVINAKSQFLEQRNKQWLAFASFIISVAGYGLWNVLIMFLHRSNEPTIYFADYGLLEFGGDISWWATLLILTTALLFFDFILQLLKIMFSPSDVELFQIYEKDLELRRMFEERSYNELKQGWLFPRDPSTTGQKLKGLVNKIFGSHFGTNKDDFIVDDETPGSAAHRKRAGTNPLESELPPSGEGIGTTRDIDPHNDDDYVVLPSGTRVKRKKPGVFSQIARRFKRDKSGSEDENVDDIIDNRLRGLESS
ncbi:hypothetical protein FT663_04447 [Candidozyma haemuli var. vulneris]|uniref:Phospholipid-transporting ATPase n=1 Tax=Candidozyma haemuli TaxID=45357 RepID=A0A2V1AV85_9ASCO|nr:hypothetical protein CXQ85_004299 [[Candida] haemuloni]KAF3987453.1 hypothetical protein FT663_04447 [[Candida] haemuloni var. vulneris]KAF3991759.1 hypothetical protein FT662_01513 [[Candida] haemuloni var. vulneris]PVH20791.1 hypothetical protein CXQ85_004299 [[Candida] haemuloni]